MTATLDGVTSKGKDKPEPTTEQKVAEELVARGPGARPVADRPGGAVQAATVRAWINPSRGVGGSVIGNVTKYPIDAVARLALTD